MPAVPATLFLGLVDGFNVCSISLLVLFISILYTLNTTRQQVLVLGAIYITSVYVSYFLLGLGIMLLSLSLPVIPHLITRISVAIMLFFGIANVLNYFRPGTLPTNFATSLGNRIVSSFPGATLTPAIVGGSLIGVHNFPCACTGGIYPAFIALISGADLRLMYLALYNLIFIISLAVILLYKQICHSNNPRVASEQSTEGSSSTRRSNDCGSHNPNTYSHHSNGHLEVLLRNRMIRLLSKAQGR